MSKYQERLVSELDRIGVTTIANGLGVARNTIYNWMAKANTPLNLLFALDAMGVDVRFVMTGTRTEAGQRPLTQGHYDEEEMERGELSHIPTLSAEEQHLIVHFRRASAERRDAAMGALLGAQSGAMQLHNSAPGAVQVGHVSCKLTVKGTR